MILVKRMREKLYSSLLSQDISFFDSKTVGELTSRLGADCQQVSRVIGNDLNLISRDTLQATCALVFLFTLSWPLAFSTLVICITLTTIMFFHGRFQKKAAKSTQDCTAKANEVSQETFSLLRTVRIYGTEKIEFRRYLKWLTKLADISLRQTDIQKLVDWLKDTDPREKELKEVILQWQRLKSYQPLTSFFDHCRTISNSENFKSNVNPTCVLTRASVLLEKEYGPCLEFEVSGIPRVKGKKLKSCMN